MGILGKALGGAGAAGVTASLEMMRAEIMSQRDARLNEYSRGLETEVRQPFQREQAATEQTFKAGEGEATRSSAKDIAAGNNATSVEVAKIGADSRVSAAEAKAERAAGDKGGITQKDGILHVLQPRYGGKFEGGMWFPDEKNRDVGLRAMQIYEQLSSGPQRLPYVEAAKQAAEQAEREEKTGGVPIGKGETADKPSADTSTSKKDFRKFW